MVPPARFKVIDPPTKRRFFSLWPEKKSLNKRSKQRENEKAEQQKGKGKKFTREVGRGGRSDSKKSEDSATSKNK